MKKADIMEDYGVSKPKVFRLLKKRVSPATANNFYPGIKRIPSIDEIYDPVTNKKRIIRYSESEQSIYKDEQPISVELSDIIFTNGSLRVNEDNPTLMEFLRVCNWNKDNKNKVRSKQSIFYEYDPAAIAEMELEQMELEIDAQHKAKTMDFDELKSIARAVGINIGRSSSEVRHDMVVFAKKKPIDFMNAMNSPETKRRVEIIEASELGILKLDPRAIKLVSSTGEEIGVVPVPIGANPVDHLTVWSMQTKDGEEFFSEIVNVRKKMLG